MAASLQAVAQLLEATLDPKQNKQGMSLYVVHSYNTACVYSSFSSSWSNANANVALIS